MSSLELIRSPFENVFSFLGGLPQGHEKALKQALYNALALLLLVVCVAAASALFIILGPFITPLLWASMCGSVLHPFKRSLASRFSLWIAVLESTRTPIFSGLLLAPMNLVYEVSEFIGSTLVNHIKTLLLIIISVLSLHTVYSYTPHICTCLVWRIGKLIGTSLAWFISCCNTSMLVIMVVTYLGLLAIFWQPHNSKKFEIASWPAWMVLSSYIVNQIGTFQVPFFFIIQIVVIICFLIEVWKTHEEKQAAGTHISFCSALKNVLTNQDSEELENKKSEEVACEDLENVEEQEKIVVEESEIENIPNLESVPSGSESLATQTDWDEGSSSSQPIPQSAELRSRAPGPSPSVESIERRFYTLLRKHNMQRDADDNNQCHTNISTTVMYQRSMGSDKYIYGVLWACVLMLIFNHLWILNLVPIPIFIYFVNHTGQYFGIWNLIIIQCGNLQLYLRKWYGPRQCALFPIPVMCLSKVFCGIHAKILNTVKNSVDAVASVVVICGVIIFTIVTTIFIAVQVYAEGIHMIQVGASVVNSTVLSNSDFFSQIIPAEWYNSMDSVVGSAYTQGREGISAMVRSSLADVDKLKAANLEKQALDIWDRAYQSWIMSGTDANFVGPTVPPQAIWENLVDGVQKSPELFNFNSILDFGRANMDSLMSVMQTIWTISKGNISLLLNSLTAVLSVVFGGGTAVLNLLLSMVVFFTALFYLLSSSGVLYKPVDMITNFSPTYGNRFAVALEEAFIGVFKASFKMAVFYGLWTWLIHNIFQMKIIYIPSVLASLLAAVPFLGTYWACVPAVLDLWLAQDKGMQAIFLLAFQFLPTSIVDTTIYKEIQGGGHPYLTGLSIAGGIFCMGVQGAIIGPLLLCGLFVAINMSSKLMMDSPTDSKISQHISQLSQLSKQLQGARISAESGKMSYIPFQRFSDVSHNMPRQ